MSKKLFLGIISALVVGSLFAVTALLSNKSQSQVHTGRSGEAHELVVYKDPACGCCGNWVGYMKAKGYKVEVIETSDVEALKKQYDIPEELYSCHTTIVNDGKYFIEGHIPEESVARLLDETPEIKGIGMPGMPSGSPGMPGSKEGPFKIMQVDATDNVSLFGNI